MKKLFIFLIAFCIHLNIFAAPAPSPAAPQNNAAAPATIPLPPTFSEVPTPPQMPVSPSKLPASAPIAATTDQSTPNKPTLNKPIPTLGSTRSAPITIPAPPILNAKGYLLIDANTGYVIAQKDQDTQMAPASLTKLMTMYVVSAALREGRIHLTDNVSISENAWRTGGSRMFVKVDTAVPLQDLINGIIVASGNDACVAVSEFIAGSESSFVDLMNQMAAKLGMKNTHYADATGLPDPNNYTTPYDLSILTRAIIFHYPTEYKWYSQKWMTYNNIKQPNRNALLFRDPTVDGLKTGHTDDAGYCLVASSKRNNMRLIAIIMGSTSSKQRASDAEALLTYGYRFFETRQLYTADKPLTTQRVWFGKNKQTQLGLARNMYITLPIGHYEKIKASLVVDKKIEAPVMRGTQYGQLQIILNNQVVVAQPLVALINDPLGGVFSRLWDHVVSWFS